jgi:hypothetical protein
MYNMATRPCGSLSDWRLKVIFQNSDASRYSSGTPRACIESNWEVSCYRTSIRR